MKIRSKLLILLLAIALAPLVAATVWQRISMRQLGRRLASNTRAALINIARRNLHLRVDDYSQIVNRDKRAVEAAVRLQAREVERLLAEDPPAEPRIFFSADYDGGTKTPTGMVTSTMHFRTGEDGERTPIPVTYDEQVYFVAAGVDEADVAADLARLSAMPDLYRFLHDANPDTMYWQYTSLEVGFHTSYPGHGGYPPEYDPRKRAWYVAARDAGELGWIVMPEVSTGTVALTAGAPVYRPDGSFAGVTAIDVPLDSVFKDVRLLPQWEAGSEKMLIQNVAIDGKPTRQLATLVHMRYQEQKLRWQQPVEHEVLASADQEEFEHFLDDVAAGRCGVREMRYKGRRSFWAYGSRRVGQAVPLIIVPYDRVVAQAEQAEQQVIDATVRVFQVAGAGVVLVIATVVLLAFRSSRAVTRPVRWLAAATEQFAEGDYDVRLDIRTGDELQELGETFNDLGPKMLERERMKASLGLAMEIQRHLLPKAPPTVEGFDIAGNSLYCDETGGDYYDFIDLVDLGEGKLGIAVGDVTGHGIGAALLMASARAVLRSHAVLHGNDLSDLFRTLNIHLVRDTGDERFMTLFYGVLEANERRLWWVSGGHDPGVLWRGAAGTVEALGNTGMPLGVLEEAEYGRAGPVALEPGDVFLVGTDGIWETHNTSGEMFGRERFLEVLRGCAGCSARNIFNAIVEAARAFRGGAAQEDDITLVVVKVL